jgi:hypothetical protein
VRVTFLSVLLFACQQDVDIPRLEKQEYFEATQVCKELESRVESDEAVVIDRITAILNNPKITQVECRLRIQLLADKYTQPYLFVPYQLRGRAEWSLALKTPNPVVRKQLLQDAVRDLKMSVAKGIESSRAPLAAAEKEIERLAASTPDASLPRSASALRAAWAERVGEKKYRTARVFVDRDCGALPEKDRADLAAETERACHSYLTEQMMRYRRNLSGIAGLSELRSMTRNEFETLFALPSAEEIILAYGPYDWARAHQESLRQVWASQGSPTALLPMAADAAKLDDRGENPWFRTIEFLAFQDLRPAVERRIAECADAPREKRSRLQTEAQGLLASWKTFVDGLHPAFRARQPIVEEHSRALTAALDRMPRDLAELDQDDLGSCFEGVQVEARLLAKEDQLRRLESQGGLTIESRRNLYTLLVAARALRLFLSGKTQEEVEQASREELQKLRQAGGAVQPDRFGPRMRKVFDSLR